EGEGTRRTPAKSGGGFSLPDDARRWPGWRDPRCVPASLRPCVGTNRTVGVLRGRPPLPAARARLAAGLSGGSRVVRGAYAPASAALAGDPAIADSWVAGWVSGIARRRVAPNTWGILGRAAAASASAGDRDRLDLARPEILRGRAGQRDDPRRGAPLLPGHGLPLL